LLGNGSNDPNLNLDDAALVHAGSVSAQIGLGAVDLDPVAVLPDLMLPIDTAHEAAHDEALVLGYECARQER